VRTFPGRFDGTPQRTPWNESLRLTSTFETRLPYDAALSMQSRHVYGRAWALRRAYYDLALDGLPVQAPGADALPAWHEVDVALARTVRVAGTTASLSLSVLNALGQSNVLDAWLVPASVEGVRDRLDRRGVGRQLLLAARISR
jgi:hypothetical protein